MEPHGLDCVRVCVRLVRQRGDNIYELYQRAGGDKTHLGKYHCQTLNEYALIVDPSSSHLPHPSLF